MKFLLLFRPLGSGGKALGPGASGSSGIRAPPVARAPPTRTTAPPPTKPPATSKFI
jgi:hypothetical protein